MSLGSLMRLKLSPRSYNNFLQTLRTFFRFSQKHGWLSKEVDLLARVEKRSEKRAPVEIFTPKEAAALFKSASAEVAPCLALAAFAGLRSAEILRLDWRDIERHAGIHRSGSAQSKDGRSPNRAAD